LGQREEASEDYGQLPSKFCSNKRGRKPCILANSWERRNEPSEKADEAGSPGQSSKNYWEKPWGSEEAVDEFYNV